MCVPCSMISPSFITRMRSASRIVDNLWAITKLVLPFIKLSIAFWILTSVLVSTELVASSRMRIFGSASIALAIVRSCFVLVRCLLLLH